MTIINVDARTLAIPLGRRGENSVRQIVFDYSAWAEQFGAGACCLYAKRSQDASAYPVALTYVGDTAIWTVSAADTQYIGRGKAELVYIVGEQIAKSVVYATQVLADIGEPSETPPDPYESWLDTLTELGAETLQNAQDAQAAADSIHGMTVSAQTLSPGSTATADWDGQAETLTLGIPTGDTGETGPQGETGAPGTDGVSPEVTVTAITGGHTVTITDANHPSGQSFDVLDGEVSQSDLDEALQDKADVIVSSASGAIASFPDGTAAKAKSVVCYINPVQSGAGDPSPDNVRPISGFTGCNVLRTGTNLIDDSIKYRQSAATVAIGNEYAYTVVLQSGTYTFSAEFLNGAYAGAYIREKNGTSNTAIWSSTSMLTSASFALASDGLYRIWLNNSNGLSASNIGRCQLEYGSTATVYEAYAGTVVPISWQSEAGTVYGGTLDVTTGVLTADYVSVSLDETAWDIGDGTSANVVSNDAVLVNRYGTGARTIFGYCNYVKTGSDGSLDITVIRTNGNSTNKVQLLGYKTYFGVETAQEFLAIVSSTPLQIVYRLATPQTYQLTSQEVTLLLGENNLWHDANGDTEVTYSADTKLYIEKLTKPSEDDMTANQNIASGRFFMVGNSLYLSTQSIATGAQIVPGTNCTALSLADALNNLNS